MDEAECSKAFTFRLKLSIYNQDRRDVYFPTFTHKIERFLSNGCEIVTYVTRIHVWGDNFVAHLLIQGLMPWVGCTSVPSYTNNISQIDWLWKRISLNGYPSPGRGGSVGS